MDRFVRAFVAANRELRTALHGSLAVDMAIYADRVGGDLYDHCGDEQPVLFAVQPNLAPHVVFDPRFAEPLEWHTALQGTTPRLSISYLLSSSTPRLLQLQCRAWEDASRWKNIACT